MLLNQNHTSRVYNTGTILHQGQRAYENNNHNNYIAHKLRDTLLENRGVVSPGGVWNVYSLLVRIELGLYCSIEIAI